VILSRDELISRLRKIKLVVSDVDGTLTNSYDYLGKKTIEYVSKLKEKGVFFTLATQRMHSSIIEIAKQLNVEIPIITVNGALIQDLKGNVLYKSVINPDYVRKAIFFADRYFVRIALCCTNEIVYTENNSVLSDFMRRIGTNYKLVHSYEPYVNDVLEIIMMGNDKNVIKYIQRKLNFPFKFYVSAKYFRGSSSQGIYNLEIKKSRINKKTAIKRLTKHLKLKKSQVAVIGDWYNDRELFEFGGTNIALKNSVAELKNLAHYVVDKDSEEDGVGEFLEILYSEITNKK
jgi:Cof subfamily protein (haloacid dehalogenase superfamily)